MANPTYPGVYMEEVSSGVRPIEAAGTSTAAFFGVAERGPIGEVKRIFNFTEFKNIYGDFLSEYFLAHAVFQFFNNGGSQCYVGRVANSPATASVTIRDRGATANDSLTISAVSPGGWGNKLMVKVDSSGAEDPGNQFNLTVYKDNRDPDSAPVRLEEYENLSMDPGSPAFVETVINSRSTNIHIAVNTDNDNFQAGYSESGAISPEAGSPFLQDGHLKFRINIHSDGYRTVDFGQQIIDDEADLADLSSIATTIETVIQGLSRLRESTPENVYSLAEVTVDNNKLCITSGHESADSKVEIIDAENPDENAAGALCLGRRNGGTELFGSALLRPQDIPDTEDTTDDYYFLGDNPIYDNPADCPVSGITIGDDGSIPGDQDYIAALNLLDTVRDVSLIAVPGIGSTAVADAGMNYCRNRPLSDCFFIADMNVHDDELEDAQDYQANINTPNSYGAVYFPWLKMLDPLGLSPEPIPVPPSGYVAGLYARTDSTRGVWKAPAGTEAMFGGSVGMVTELTDVQHGLLNKEKISVCVIRKFPGSGIVAWGARTMSSDPEWKYIPVRRMGIMLRVSIFNGIQWAVFEPNDEELWSQLRLNIRSFMMTLFRKGAFQGSSPSDAFFVKCDSETTPQADIDLGIVNILIGFAPLKPAEFIVVKISQKAGQAS